jgi:Flp pilus assembly protein TadD
VRIAEPPPLPGPSTSGRSGALWPGRLAVAVQEVLDHTRAQRFDAALAVADAARSEYPATLFGPWLAGIVELGRGDARLAEAHLRESLAISPRSTRVLTLLARTWSRQRGAAHAADQLIALVERDPGFALPWQIAAHAYVEARQPARAEAALRGGFGQPSAGAVPYRELAALYLELDRPADAFRIQAEGLARHPDDAVLLAAQARLQQRAGNSATAIALLERAHTANPDDAAAALALAARLAQGDQAARERAVALAREVALDTPRAAEVLGTLGAVLLDAGADAGAARDHLLGAVRAAPDDPALHYRLALALNATGEAAAARRALETALALPGAFDERPLAQAALQAGPH